MPFAATHALRWAADGTLDGWWTWNGAAWVEDPAWLGTNGSAVAFDPVLETVELQIPLVAIGATTTVDLWAAWLDDTTGAEATYGATPAASITDGALDPDPLSFWEFHVQLADAPGDAVPQP